MQNTLTGFGVQLSRLTQDKIEMVRLWRNHPDVANYMLDKHIISSAEQVTWFNNLSTKDDRAYWLITYKSNDIGLIYAQSNDGTNLLKAETIVPGLYLAPDCKYRSSVLAFSPSLVLIEYLFSLPNCNHIVAQVVKDNTSAIRYNESLGYEIVSDFEAKSDTQLEHELITMELAYDNFEQAKTKLSKILRF